MNGILSKIITWATVRRVKAAAPATHNELVAGQNYLSALAYRAEAFPGALIADAESVANSAWHRIHSAKQSELAPTNPAPKGTPMAAVDLSPLASEFDAVSAYLAKLAAGSESAVQLQAALDAEKTAHAATQAALDQANADLAASAQAVTAMAAKYAALVPAA